MIKLSKTEFDKRIGANIADTSGGVLFQAENKIQIPSDRNSIVIGVGGSGSSTVEDVKRIMQSKFVDWKNRVAFLAVDADSLELENRKSLTRAEKHGLVCESGANHRWHNEGKRLEKVKRWVNKDFYADVQDPNGAARNRQAAKARLYDWGNVGNPNDNQLINKINAVFNDLTHGAPQKEVQVYIALGVAGGTGSGLIIDIADLVHRAAPDGVRFEITGFFYLPDTVEEFFKNDVATKAGIHANGYAALKELDYYFSLFQRGMNYPELLETNEPSEKVRYLGTEKVLYNMVFLISGRGNEPNQTARKAVVESLVNLIAEVRSDDGDIAHQFLSKSFLTNKSAARTATIAGLEEVDGVYLEDTYDYCSIGVGTASIPEETIKSYAIGQLAQSFYNGEEPWRELPLDDQSANLEMVKLIMTNSVDFINKIREACNKLNWPKESIPPTEREILAGSKDAAQAEMLRINEAQQNAGSEMAQYLEDYYHRFRNAASVFMKKYGPDCLINLWKGILPGGGVYQGGGMASRLDDIFGWSEGAVNITGTAQRLQITKENCAKLIKLRAPENWRNAFKLHETEKMTSRVIRQVFGNEERTFGLLLEKYINPIKVFMEQVECFSQVLKKMQYVYSFLGSSFANFNQFNATEGNTSINYNILGDNTAYDWAKNILYKTINQTRAKDLRNELVDSFMSNSPEWAKETGETASDFMPARILYDKAVSRVLRFDDDLSLEAYMRYVKRTEADIQTVSNRIIAETVSKASSLFVRSDRELRNDTAYTYLLIPSSFRGEDGGAEIYEAFQNAARNQMGQNLRVFPSPITGRIVCYHVACALPLYTLAGLPEWERAYDASNRVMIHSNESDMGRFNPDEGLRWEDYPALTLGRHSRPSKEVEPRSREERFLKYVFNDIFERAVNNDILRLKENEKRQCSYEFVNVSKLALPADFVLDLDDYGIKDEFGFFQTGLPLFDYLAQGRQLPVLDVKLHSTEKLTQGQKDKEDARRRAERVLRRHVPMFIDVKKSLRQIEALTEQIRQANQRTLADMLRQFPAELIAYDFLRGDGEKNITWTLHGYPKQGSKQQIIRMNALAMKPGKEKLLFEKGWRYLILAERFVDIFAKDSWKDIAVYRENVKEVEKAIANGEIQASPYLARLRTINDEAVKFIAEFGEGVAFQRTAREEFASAIGLQNPTQQREFWETSMAAYEYVTQLFNGLEQNME